jgi:uncharacterized OB-fold protein
MISDEPPRGATVADANPAQVPIAEGLFTWPSDEPRLIGSACEDCSLVAFPAQDHCPGCGSDRVAEHLLDRRGTLYTWTTQSFPPVAPPYVGDTNKATFEPFGIGWVQVSDTLMIEARLTENDPEKLEFGMPVELVLIPLSVDDEGNEVLSYAFQPAL